MTSISSGSEYRQSSALVKSDVLRKSTPTVRSKEVWIEADGEMLKCLGSYLGDDELTQRSNFEKTLFQYYGFDSYFNSSFKQLMGNVFFFRIRAKTKICCACKHIIFWCGYLILESKSSGSPSPKPTAVRNGNEGGRPQHKFNFNPL